MPAYIPDRWIPYEACGKVIEGTRIICFKVPLRKTAQINNEEIKEIWDPPTLLRKIPKLGAVIDLTNTTRYYDPKDLEEAGIIYKKIYMPGQIIPPAQLVTRFMDWVDEFLSNNCESLIGVHCTHGLNRTGYMVCRYMRDRLKIPGKEAIKKFEEARGYRIERDNYIADILGNEPPPPDFSKPTIPKPVDKRNIAYSSPLKDYEEEEISGRDRFGRKRYNRSGDDYRERNSDTKRRKDSDNVSSYRRKCYVLKKN